MDTYEERHRRSRRSGCSTGAGLTASPTVARLEVFAGRTLGAKSATQFMQIMTNSVGSRNLKAMTSQAQTNKDCVFETLSEPREVPFRDVGRNGFTVFLAAGIVNPFGPTLEVIASDADGEDGGRLPIVNMTVNPFSQCSRVTGYVTVGETWNSLLDVQPFLTSSLQACPSLLLPSVYHQHEQAVQFYARFLQQFANGAGLLAQVKRFPSNPWNRIGAEMKGTSGGLLARLLGGPRANSPRRLNPEQAKELAELQLAPKSLLGELQAFLAAWSGSIEFQGNGPVAGAALSFEWLVQFLARLSITCRLPEELMSNEPEGQPA
jgi:hypothetical protein